MSVSSFSFFSLGCQKIKTGSVYRALTRVGSFEPINFMEGFNRFDPISTFLKVKIKVFGDQNCRLLLNRSLKISNPLIKIQCDGPGLV